MTAASKSVGLGSGVNLGAPVPPASQNMRRDPIKSTARTLEVLELFHEQRRPLRLNYIFQRLGYPQSSTTTLLKSMSVLGYLNYHRPTRTYFPTPRVSALGDWVNHYVYGRGELFEMMQFIYDNTQETVAVSSQNDIFIQHIRVIQPPKSEKIVIPEGSMRVLTHSCAGLALMSRMDAKMVDKLCRHINVYVQDKTLAMDLAALEQQLNFIRAEGYSYLAAFPFPDASGVAMTLPQTPHGIPLTIGVGGLNSNIARQRTHILATMRAAIQTYHRKLLANADARAEGYGETPEEADQPQLH